MTYSILLGVALLLQISNPARAAEPASDAEQRDGLRFVECWFPVPADVEVDCAEMRTDPQRGGYTLPVVIFRDRSEDHQNDPLIYLSGGPGNSSFLDSNGIDHWFYWAEIANLSRDLILVDQRGTGLSKPQFNCRAYESHVRKILRQNLSLQEEHRATLAAVEECIGLMKVAGHSLADFSTTQSAQDMNELMLALGYRHWNVMGGSYGTRLALDWLRLPDQRIRALVLDSVYPLDKGSIAEWPALLHDSFSYFWQACAEGSLCPEGESKRDLETDFWRAMAVLKEEPRSLTVPLWEGGWPLKVVVNDHRFLGMIYTALYDNTLHEDVLLAIDEVLKGGTEALKKLAQHSVNSELAPDFNALVYLAVDCSESVVVSREDFEAVRRLYPKWSAYTEYAWRYDMCRPIPRRSDLQQFKKPVKSDMPVLILSGGFDPVTPAAWAREVADRLPNSQHWHLPNLGHGVVAGSACVHQAFRSFLDAPLEEHPMPCDKGALQ
ncbi:alpha/beta hydrolase [Gilvimarinus sp. F26214L]|uniref:alpha/beta hydrolase n=1 Tax=Gilvimarinus sp. DZF01 TaxID=3461371 RepID=UPI004045B022